MLHLSVAQHYCGGELAATKVSLTGALASCGMEEENCPYDHDGDLLESHCCDDFVTSYTIDNNYTPVTKAAAGFDQVKLQVPVMSFEKPVRIAFIVNRLWTDGSPPGEFLTSAVDLPSIRVFRI